MTFRATTDCVYTYVYSITERLKLELERAKASLPSK